MAVPKLLALFTIVLVATETVAALSEIPQNGALLNPTLEHAVYSRAKRQFNFPYGSGRRNTPMPILLGGGGIAGRSYGGPGIGFNGGYNAGRGVGARGSGGARGGGARGGFGFGGGRGRG